MPTLSRGAVPSLLALAATGASALSTGQHRVALHAAPKGDGTITKVVKMLQDMKKQVEAEAKEDEDIFGKMDCWCTTNKAEKTAAVKAAEKKLDELASVIEEGNALVSALTTEIAAHKEDIAADKEALAEAEGLHSKQKEEFEASEKDMMESSTLLKQAIAILQKVQLLQHDGSAVPAHQSLVQVKEIVDKVGKVAQAMGGEVGGVYKSVMQKDLWDVLGSMPLESPHHIMALNAQPMQGNAAGVSSYNARSSRIFGLLSQMKANFDRNLGDAQREMVTAEIAFQRLRSSKEGEIAAATRAVEEKTARVAETKEKVAQAKEDVEVTSAQLDADQKFLVDLEKRCTEARTGYAERSKTRLEEARAISEAIVILTNDDARDVFSKTVSFVQVAAQRQPVFLQASKEARAQAVQKLLALSRKQRGSDGAWRLATLAVSAQVDGLERVKQMMEEMIQQLKRQQADEVEKNDECKADIHDNDMDTAVKKTEEEDLKDKFAGLEGTVKSLEEDMAELKQQMAQAHISLKKAGEERKAENKEFQQVVSDQRATVVILKKAIARLKEFYDNEFLIQTQRKQAPPQAGLDYDANGGGIGVLNILEKVVQEAERADKEAVQEEQKSQEAYSELVANVNDMLRASQASISEKAEAKAHAQAEMLDTKAEMATVFEAIQDLLKQGEDLHKNCDYLLKNFNIRQQARMEEVDAIKEALSILSGADFGRE